MFSRNKKNKTSGTLVRMVPSIISIDLTIKGDLESAGEIQVDGQVDGDIRSQVLLVGKKATVNGEIYAETVRVHGNVNGQIKAKFVNLAKSARVVGDIHHENLSIQEGAFLEGRMVHMNEQEYKRLYLLLLRLLRIRLLKLRLLKLRLPRHQPLSRNRKLPQMLHSRRAMENPQKIALIWLLRRVKSREQKVRSPKITLTKLPTKPMPGKPHKLYVGLKLWVRRPVSGLGLTLG
ncbi:MAG: polymer-forming cytoskeletal protein [Magnetovibrio sp.]|nr:polymer-forming cytoskeletal protein [Magnetovibrio sp.]